MSDNYAQKRLLAASEAVVVDRMAGAGRAQASMSKRMLRGGPQVPSAREARRAAERMARKAGKR